MATEALKSTSITNLDSVPVVRNTAGSGAGDMMKTVFASITNTAGVTAGSTYQMVRLRSGVSVKHVYFETAAGGGASAVDIGWYYSDSKTDGTQASLQGTAIIDNFHADNLSTVSAVPISDETNQSGQYTAALRNQPLWQALGLSTDPGGYFDLVITAEATLTNAVLMGVEVQYTDHP